MLDERQTSILKAWVGYMGHAYTLGIDTALNKKTPGWWSPLCDASKPDDPCNEMTDEDVEAFNRALDAGYSVHAQVEQVYKRQEFDVEWNAALHQGIADGIDGKTASYVPKGAWWYGYAAMLNEAYNDAYNKARSVAGSSNVGWWIAGLLGLAAIVTGVGFVLSGKKTG